MTSALRRVRGVKTARVDSARDEAWVVRRVGRAADSELVAAIARAGYGAWRLPIEGVSIDVRDMGCGGCPEKVRAALERVRGVRTVLLKDRQEAKVYYDARRATPATLREAVRKAGFTPS